MVNDFLKDIIKSTGNEYASLVEDGVEAGDVENFIDTGSYIFNALLSGSIHGGLPANKITALAGESATGKTYFLMGIVKNFLDANPDAGVIYFESESAITKPFSFNFTFVFTAVLFPIYRCPSHFQACLKGIVL